MQLASWGGKCRAQGKGVDGGRNGICSRQEKRCKGRRRCVEAGGGAGLHEQVQEGQGLHELEVALGLQEQVQEGMCLKALEEGLGLQVEGQGLKEVELGLQEERLGLQEGLGLHFCSCGETAGALLPLAAEGSN